jgi:hypothetical protein
MSCLYIFKVTQMQSQLGGKFEKEQASSKKRRHLIRLEIP